MPQWIVFEGVDRSGKSSQIQTLKSFLVSQSLDVIQSREVGGTPLAEEIRRLFHHPDLDLSLDHIRDLLLVLAARRDHWSFLLRQSSSIVLIDRLIDSTLVYQGSGDPDREDLIQYLHELCLPALHFPILEFVFFFPNPESLKERLKESRKTSDRFDVRAFEIIWRTNELYKKLCESGQSIRVCPLLQRVPVDASQSQKTLSRVIRDKVMEFLRNEKVNNQTLLI